MPRGEGRGSVTRISPAVLVVEDDPLCREWCARVLRAAGYRVAIARTARYALKLIPTFDPEVVLSDLNLPDALDRDRLHSTCTGAVRPGAPVLILMSAGCSHDSVAHAAGRTILLKPFEPRDLLAAVSAALESDLCAIDSQVRDEPDEAPDRLSSAFRVALRGELEGLDRRIAGRNWCSVLDTLHRLRGAAAICGHADFAAHCRELAGCIESGGPLPGWGRSYLDLLQSGESLCNAGPALTRCE